MSVQFDKLKKAFFSICASDLEAQREMLQLIRENEPALAHELESLMEHDQSLKKCLSNSEIEIQIGKELATLLELGIDRGMPNQIGQYRLLRLISSGGMGDVYEAEQDFPRRRVAIKVIRSGILSKSILQRFEREAQILARLNHPCIARIYDVGVTDIQYGSQPYLVMELVNGIPVNKFIDQHKLSLCEKLNLLIKIAEAVHHAHSNGIIHRDLKPGNILVNDAAEPTIVDFGVSRTIDDEMQDTVVKTLTGQLVGTLAYMSPEQVKGDVTAIDIRSDIYSLGVVAYRILTLKLPHNFKNCSFAEALQILTDKEPVGLRLLDKSIPKDIETIVLKSMEKASSSRYQSADEFATDIQRFINGEAIIARQRTVTYQLTKFVSRNKSRAALIVTMVTTIVIGIMVIRMNEIKAKKQIEISRIAVLNQLNSEIQAYYDQFNIKPKKYLDSLAANVAKLHASYESKALLAHRIGHLYQVAGYYQDAYEWMSKSLDLYENSIGLENRDAIILLLRLVGIGLYGVYDHSMVEEYLDRGLVLSIELLGDDDELTIGFKTSKSSFLSQRKEWKEAEKCARQVVDAYFRTQGDEHQLTNSARVKLATILSGSGQVDTAIDLLKTMIETYIDTNDKTPNWYILSQERLAGMYWLKGDYERGVDMFRDALKARRLLLPKFHPNLVICIQGLAVCLRDQRKFDESLRLMIEARKIKEDSFPEGHPYRANTHITMSTLLFHMNDLKNAEPLAKSALDARENHPDVHPSDVAETKIIYGLIKLRQGKVKYAESLLLEALKLRQDNLEKDNWLIANAESALGVCLLEQKRYSEAEPLLVNSYPIIQQARGDINSWTKFSHDAIEKLYKAIGQPVHPDSE